MQTTEIKELEVNGKVYVLKDSVQLPKTTNTVLVRAESAGVFYGELVETNLGEGWVRIKNARRVWYWSGAASLSQLAVDGTTKPKECKFPVAVPEISITKIIEVIPMTEKAVNSLNEVAIWKQ